MNDERDNEDCQRREDELQQVSRMSYLGFTNALSVAYLVVLVIVVACLTL